MELLTRVLCDPMPSMKVDAIYLFGQTAENELSVLESAVALYHLKICENILLIDTPPMNGYPGCQAWSTYLLNHGVDKNNIKPVPSTEKENLHTLIEAQSVVNFLLDHDMQRIIVMAAPFHQLRAFMTLVTVSLKMGINLSIYGQAGKPLSWEQIVTHSQGTLEAPRTALIHTELERIEKYQQKGDLASFSEVKHYLDQRNN